MSNKAWKIDMVFDKGFDFRYKRQTVLPHFLFCVLCDQFIIKKEPMNREDSHKSIGSATMRLALDE